MSGTVLITGVTSGIGEYLAKQYIENGYTVIGLDVNEIELAIINHKNFKYFFNITVWVLF